MNQLLEIRNANALQPARLEDSINFLLEAEYRFPVDVLHQVRVINGIGRPARERNSFLEIMADGFSTHGLDAFDPVTPNERRRQRNQPRVLLSMMYIDQSTLMHRSEVFTPQPRLMMRGVGKHSVSRRFPDPTGTGCH